MQHELGSRTYPKLQKPLAFKGKIFGDPSRRAKNAIRQWLAVTNIPKPAHRFAGTSKPSD
jgi:hypothetical protein